MVTDNRKLLKYLTKVSTGNIILVKHNAINVVSKAIAGVEEFQYTHVMAMMDDENVLNIAFPFSRIVKFEDYLKKEDPMVDIIVIDPRFLPSERTEFVSYLKKYNGRIYNVFQILGFMVSYAFKRMFNSELKNPFYIKNGVICASIAKALKKVDDRFDLSKAEGSKDINMVSPKDFYAAADSKDNKDYKIIYKS